MSRFYSYLNSTKNILSLYNGGMPFSAFLKNYFSKEKKFGSRDRKMISSLAYNYFRTGHAVRNESLEEGLITGIFLCNNSSNEVLRNIRPEWNEKIDLPITNKLQIAGIDAGHIFPFSADLSAGVDVQAFNISFLVQPKVFVRIRPGKQSIVKKKLKTSEVDFEEINESCLAFQSGRNLEDILDINREVVIQDFNSQKAGEMLLLTGANSAAKVWDCCAASGGKSIMAFDLLPGIELTVSDVRASILANLIERFKDAGITRYRSFIKDLSVQKEEDIIPSNETFDIIICDAPCSGSGTWSRTPEQLYYFQHDEITRYSNLQKRIASNTIRRLKKGGYFLYITCSVFKEENEAVVDYLQTEAKLTLLKMELVKGYEIKADTMFAALFQYNS